MVGEQDQGVSLAKGVLQPFRESHVLQASNSGSWVGQWIVYKNLHPETCQPTNDRDAWRVACVGRVALERQAQRRNDRTLDWDPRFGVRVFHQTNDVLGHPFVDVPCHVEHPGLESMGCGDVGQVVGVLWQTIAADARSGVQKMGLWFSPGGFQDLRDVQAQGLGRERELVGERDVHVAVDVLEELRRLCDLRAPERVDGDVKDPEDSGSKIGASLVDPPHGFWQRPVAQESEPLQGGLWNVGKAEADASLQPRPPFKDGGEYTFCCSWGNCALENHESTLAEPS